MSGEEAFGQIRAIRPEAKVIFCSGYTELEATERIAGKGLAGFIHKRYRLASLRAKLHEALSVS